MNKKCELIQSLGRFLAVYLVSMAMASCGGSSEDGPIDTGNSGEETELEKTPPAPPAEVSTTFDEGVITITWSDSVDAESYSIYYSSDADFTAENYSVFEYGTIVLDQSSPATVSLENLGPIYYFAVTAQNDDGESELSGKAMVISRFTIGDDETTVLDWENMVEWERCTYGQEWDGAECAGDAIRLSPGDAREPYFSDDSDGWEIPSNEMLRSIIYCSSGVPVQFGPEGKCGSSSDSPVVVDFFSNTPGDANYYDYTVVEHIYDSSIIDGTYFWVTSVNFGDGHQGSKTSYNTGLSMYRRMMREMQ